jgi:hypothetical protein
LAELVAVFVVVANPDASLRASATPATAKLMATSKIRAKRRVRACVTGKISRGCRNTDFWRFIGIVTDNL